MARRTSEAKSAASWPRRTAMALGDALGVHRNTIAAWKHEGAPDGHDEFQWRAWAAAMASQGKGYDCPKDPEPALLQLLAAAGIGDYRARQAKHLPVLGIGDAPEPGVPAAAVKTSVQPSSEDRKALADAIIAETKANDAKRDSDLRWHRLVYVEELHPLLDGWLAAIDEVLLAPIREIPELVTASPEIQSAMKIAIEKAIRGGRDQAADQLLVKLKAYLEQLAQTVGGA